MEKARVSGKKICGVHSAFRVPKGGQDAFREGTWIQRENVPGLVMGRNLKLIIERVALTWLRGTDTKRLRLERPELTPHRAITKGKASLDRGGV